VSAQNPQPPRPGFETLFVNNRATTRRLRKARIVVIDGPDRGKSLVIDKPRISVGRSMICELALTDRSVSGTHAEIEAIESGYVVRDLGSTNGCYLGEVRLREAVVPLGTRLRMGTSTLQFEPADGTVDIPLSQQDRFFDLVGRSVPMRQIFAQLEKVAPSDLTVLVTGETGTGKELVARAIHHASRRAKGPLIVQDCSAMPHNLVESTLFGHERGAFTGASDRHIGSFEQASGGTLFLDEIGELPLEQQAKLLRVLEQREIRRVGGEKTIAVDVRVVAATNRDLRVMVSQGQFREDLYYRLGVVTVELPPLRARREDIPLIANAMLAQFCSRQPELGPREFGKESLERLQALPYPGNVRELRNLIERAASLADGLEITVADLMPASVTRTPPAGMPALSTKAAETVLAAQQAGALTDELTRLPFKDAKARVLETFEPAYLRALLARHDGNITRAAQSAGLTRYHLRELCKRYGLRSVDNEPE
jgi:DNA-binding NtrC family response regulator